ncbi:hypothetical protein HYV64_01505 [Candidatus Shapirobacteria bacterium]|nr:hypothetical protein [Candidatus Shapirobacteria bacterium]
MIFADFRFITLWWATYLIIGLSALPLTFYFFNKFWDKGYIFSKTIGLVLVTFLTLTLGIFKLVPFTTISIAVIVLGIFGFGLWLLKSNSLLLPFKKSLKTHIRVFIFEEVIFFLVLTVWSIVRGYAPDIEGLEKFMDWGFVNSALRSKFMPPIDMWFASEPINYYYFGHLETAVLAKISGIDSAIIYNLAIASACAVTFSHTFSLASNLVSFTLKKVNLRLIILGGIFSALVLSFGGNLHPLYKIGSNIIKNEGRLTISKETISKASESYWYPDATRFIGFDPDTQDKTIHEFPLYSFVVADLHGHMNDIPNVLLFMAVLLAIFIAAPIKNISWLLILSSSFLLSVVFMTNAWDFAVYGMVFGIFSFFAFLKQNTFLRSLWLTVVHGLLTIVLWYIFTLPFSINFTPMAEGLKLADAHTPFYQLFILYGGFWLIVFPFILDIIYRLFAKKIKSVNMVDIFVLVLIVTATILVIVPEIGYVKDIYIYEHRRANTMFKLVYQAFILYSLVSGYVLIYFRKNILVKLVILLVVASHLTYPFFAIKSYYGLKTYHGMWGLKFLQTSYKDNLEAIKWLNKNIDGQPVILEAVGDSYTTFGQISMATGLPTVQGWVVHEWLWRGGYDLPAARQTDVQNIYEATEIDVVQPILQKYSIEYVFVGDKEREKYPMLNEKIFVDLGAKIVFESGLTRIYKLN